MRAWCYRRGTPPDATYTFKHALVQDAAYDSLLKSKRQQLHARIAQVLEEDFADRVANEPELLAHHYTQAGNSRRGHPLVARGRQAGGRGEWRCREAVGHFQKGLALIEQLPPSPERDGLELSIREPLNAAWTALRRVGRRGGERERRSDPRAGRASGPIPELLDRAVWAMWVNTTTQGRIADSLEWAERLLAEGDAAGDDRSADLRAWRGHDLPFLSRRAARGARAWRAGPCAVRPAARRRGGCR